ncbi:MAG: hypothetical protein ACK5P5_02565 [Pseudobdellovibrionaceae bacterium]
MKFYTNLNLLICLCLLSILGCSDENRLTSSAQNYGGDGLFAPAAQETVVTFQALYLTHFKTLEEYKAVQNPISKRQVLDLTMFLFGPLTHRQLAGVHRPEDVTVHSADPVLKNGLVYVPFTYHGRWLIRDSILDDSQLIIPLPYNSEIVYSKGWKNCTDSHPSHQTQSMMWYYWDPARINCDHQLGVHYQNVVVEKGEIHQQTILSYPEYHSMIKNVADQRTLSMTFAFGYVEDPAQPRPFKDSDSGAMEFQDFNRVAQQTLAPLGFKSQPLLASNYQSTSNLRIGTKWLGQINGVDIEIKIVISAVIDQMDLFAKSYAQDHDGFFGWFGHSRVGSGFDAEQFRRKLLYQPHLFTLSQEYQLIYWAGCNSYSYYTTPFFEMKAQLNPNLDPKGTKKLDIMSNALPSYFAFNAHNAEVMLNALIGFNTPKSYQDIITQLESHGNSWDVPVIVNVLGDEDNQ